MNCNKVALIAFGIKENGAIQFMERGAREIMKLTASIHDGFAVNSFLCHSERSEESPRATARNELHLRRMN